MWEAEAISRCAANTERQREGRHLHIATAETWIAPCIPIKTVPSNCATWPLRHTERSRRVSTSSDSFGSLADVVAPGRSLGLSARRTATPGQADTYEPAVASGPCLNPGNSSSRVRRDAGRGCHENRYG